MSIEEIIRSITETRNNIKNAVKKLVDELYASNKIRVFSDVPKIEEIELCAIDGGFQSVKAYVDDLIVMKVARVIQKNETFYTEYYNPDGDLPYIISYGDDTILEGNSLKMLKFEAELAEKSANECDKVLLDGPLINPPVSFLTHVESIRDVYKRNLSKRIGLLAREASKLTGIIKRPLRRLLTRYEQAPKASETIVLIETLIEIRSRLLDEEGRESLSRPIIIGPFVHNYSEDLGWISMLNVNISVYNRYLQRTVTHKPVVVERYHNDFPERLISDVVWPPTARARGPSALELAHLLASVSSNEVYSVASIIYRGLRGKEYGRCSDCIYFKSYGSLRRQD